MKVKIGNEFYDSEKEPIMIILTDGDESGIRGRDSQSERYASIPNGYFDSRDAVFEWMYGKPVASIITDGIFDKERADGVVSELEACIRKKKDSSA